MHHVVVILVSGPSISTWLNACRINRTYLFCVWTRGINRSSLGPSTTRQCKSNLVRILIHQHVMHWIIAEKREGRTKWWPYVRRFMKESQIGACTQDEMIKTASRTSTMASGGVIEFDRFLIAKSHWIQSPNDPLNEEQRWSRLWGWINVIEIG